MVIRRLVFFAMSLNGGKLLTLFYNTGLNTLGNELNSSDNFK